MNQNNLIQKKLTKSLTSKEEVLFDKWIIESKENKNEFQKLQSVWVSIHPVVTPSLDLVQAKRNFWERAAVRQMSTVGVQFPWYRMAAAVLLLLASSFLLFNYWYDDQVVLEAKGNMVETELPDGSKIRLYNDSRITYDKNFGQDNRYLQLEGLAFFEVTKDKTKPFIITCQDGTVKVLGTSFEVESYESNATAEVSVITGEVAVSFKQDSSLVLLHKGDKIVYQRDNDILIKKGLSKNELAWKAGDLVFDETPINEALKALSAYFHKSFTLQDQSNCKITTTFNSPTLTEVIDELTFLLDADIKLQDHQVIIKTSNCF